MKVLDIPKSGKCREWVFYRVRNRQYQRRQVIPADPRTVRQRRSRGAMGAVSQAWGEALTEEERLAWNVAGPKVQSRPQLGRGPLTGQMHFTGINGSSLFPMEQVFTFRVI